MAAALSLQYQELTEQRFHETSSMREITKDPPGSLVGSLHKTVSCNTSMESTSPSLTTNFPAREAELLSSRPTTIQTTRRSKSLRNILSRLNEPFAEDECNDRDASDSLLEKTEKSSKPLRSILHRSSHGKSCSDLSCDIGFMSSGGKKKRAGARHRVFDQTLALPRKEATESLNKDSLATVQAMASPTITANTAKPNDSDPRAELFHVPDVQEDMEDTRETKSNPVKAEIAHPAKNVGKLESPLSHTSSKNLHQLIVQPLRNVSSDTTSRLSRSLTDLKRLRKPPAHQALPDCPFDDDFRILEKKNSERSLGIGCDGEESVSHLAANVSLFDMSELTDDLELSMVGSDFVDVTESSMLQLNICDPGSVDVLSAAGSKKKDEMFGCHDRNGTLITTYGFEDYELYGDQTAETVALADSESDASDEISLTPSLADLLCVEDLAPLSSIGDGNSTSFSRHVCYVVD